MFFCQFDRAPAAFDRSADRDDARNARFICATQHIVEIIGEIRKIEMCVRFD
jgi:hypothetical protein